MYSLPYTQSPLFRTEIETEVFGKINEVKSRLQSQKSSFKKVTWEVVLVS